MKESEVEKHLKTEVERHSGECLKFTCPGRVGVNDRLVIWPERFVGKSVVHFVETKAPGKTARPVQERFHSTLSDLGVTVLVLDTIPRVNMYVNKVLSGRYR